MKNFITPCFILNEKEFEKNIMIFKAVLKRYFKHSVLGYSFKTNALPRLLYLAKKMGCAAEVVSSDEFYLAEAIGFEKDKIIFNGPIKDRDLFCKALSDGCIVNIDSLAEIDFLKNEHSTNVANIGIRVNFDLESVLPGHSSTGDSGGRFGFCYENGELHKAIQKLKGIENVRICGLHMHISNASKSPKVYKELANVACKIAREEKLNLSYIDFGGGYFGGGDDGQAYEEYVKTMYAELNKYGMTELQIILEPGASVVATAFSYIVTAKDVKDTTYGRFVITDGTRLHIDPFLTKNSYKISISATGLTNLNKQSICGYTCMEKDRFMIINNEREIKVGDNIEFNCVGSYTLNYNSMFISFLPTVYSRNGNNYSIVREKWSINEVLQKCIWKF